MACGAGVGILTLVGWTVIEPTKGSRDCPMARSESAMAFLALYHRGKNIGKTVRAHRVSKKE